MSIPTVDELAEALHDVMCDISHHDRPPARCSKWLKYPAIARSAVRRLEERQRADVEAARVQAHIFLQLEGGPCKHGEDHRAGGPCHELMRWVGLKP